MRCIGDSTRNAGFQPVAHLIEALDRPSGIVIDERLVALVYVKSSLSRGGGSLSENLTHARDLAGAARQLLASLGIQGAPPRFPTIAMAGLLLAAGAAALLLPATDAERFASAERSDEQRQHQHASKSAAQRPARSFVHRVDHPH